MVSLQMCVTRQHQAILQSAGHCTKKSNAGGAVGWLLARAAAINAAVCLDGWSASFEHLGS
jgi:hypothetical protein